MTADKRAFVVSTFASNYRRRSEVRSDEVWRRCVLGPFERVLPMLDVRIAEVPGEPGEYMGWSASHGETLFYCFVKKDYRGRKIGRGLLPLHIEYLAFQTIDGRAFLHACGQGATPRPWAAFDLIASAASQPSPYSGGL